MEAEEEEQTTDWATVMPPEPTGAPTSCSGPGTADTTGTNGGGNLPTALLPTATGDVGETLMMNKGPFPTMLVAGNFSSTTTVTTGVTMAEATETGT